MLLFVRNVQSKNKAKVVKKCHNFWFKTIKQRYKILINLIFSWRENTKQTVFNSPLLKRTIYMQQFNYCNLLPYKLEKKAFNKSLPSKLKNEVEKIWACLMLSKNKTKKKLNFASLCYRVDTQRQCSHWVRGTYFKMTYVTQNSSQT